MLRLAEVVELSTGELIERFTIDGVFLKSVEEIESHPCVFLGPEGCTVHSGRPAACRIYPLGRSSNLTGEELFSLVEPHPQTEGVYGEQGTIGEYVDAQGLAPYIEASKRYLSLWHRLAQSGAMDGELGSADEEHVHPYDVDALVTRYCDERGLEHPRDIATKVDRHIEAIEAMIPN